MVNRPEALIIDIEQEGFDIIIVSGGIPAIMRTLTNRPDYPLAKKIQHVVEEFERTLQFYNSSQPGEPLSRTTPLFVTGGLVGDVEVVQAVAAGVEYQVEHLESPLQSPPHFPVAQYAVNIGLALKKISMPESPGLPNINILPDIYRPHAPSARQVLFVPGILAGIALLFPLYQVANSATTEAYQAQAEYSSLNQQLHLRQIENEKIKQIEDAIDQVQQNRQNMKAKLNNLSSGRSETYHSLHLVAVDVLPADARLDSVALEGSDFNLQGNATSYEVALNYAYALRETGKFSTVQLHSLSAAEDGKVSFSITLN